MSQARVQQVQPWYHVYRTNDISVSCIQHLPRSRNRCCCLKIMEKIIRFECGDNGLRQVHAELVKNLIERNGLKITINENSQNNKNRKKIKLTTTICNWQFATTIKKTSLTSFNIRDIAFKQIKKLVWFIGLFFTICTTFSSQQISKINSMNSSAGLLVKLHKRKWGMNQAKNITD